MLFSIFADVMLKTVEGYYENGHIFLKEVAPVDEKTEVIVTFLAKEIDYTTQGRRIPGAFKGRINVPDDFVEPLEDLNEYMY